MAGKRKNPADNWMPPRVYQGKAAYEFRNKDNKAIRLCALDAPRSAVWLAYEKAVGDEKERNTFQALTEQFMTSPDFMDLAVETRKDYTKYSGKVLPVFGKIDPDKIKPEHIRRYMDQRGLSSRTQANREKSLKWSTKTGHRVRVFSSIDFPIRLVVTHHYIRAVLVRCNIQRYSPLLRELHR